MADLTIGCLLCKVVVAVKDFNGHLHDHFAYYPERCLSCKFATYSCDKLNVHAAAKGHIADVQSHRDEYKENAVKTVYKDSEYARIHGVQRLMKKIYAQQRKEALALRNAQRGRSSDSSSSSASPSPVRDRGRAASPPTRIVPQKQTVVVQRSPSRKKERHKSSVESTDHHSSNHRSRERDERTERRRESGETEGKRRRSGEGGGRGEERRDRREREDRRSPLISPTVSYNSLSLPVIETGPTKRTPIGAGEDPFATNHTTEKCMLCGKMTDASFVERRRHVADRHVTVGESEAGYRAALYQQMMVAYPGLAWNELQCTLCRQDVCSENGRKTHVSNYHYTLRLRCPLCTMSACNPLTVNDHLRSAHGLANRRHSLDPKVAVEFKRVWNSFMRRFNDYVDIVFPCPLPPGSCKEDRKQFVYGAVGSTSTASTATTRHADVATPMRRAETPTTGGGGRARRAYSAQEELERKMAAEHADLLQREVDSSEDSDGESEDERRERRRKRKGQRKEGSSEEEEEGEGGKRRRQEEKEEDEERKTRRMDKENARKKRQAEMEVKREALEEGERARKETMRKWLEHRDKENASEGKGKKRQREESEDSTESEESEEEEEEEEGGKGKNTAHETSPVAKKKPVVERTIEVPEEDEESSEESEESSSEEEDEDEDKGREEKERRQRQERDRRQKEAKEEAKAEEERKRREANREFSPAVKAEPPPTPASVYRAANGGGAGLRPVNGATGGDKGTSSSSGASSGIKEEDREETSLVEEKTSEMKHNGDHVNLDPPLTLPPRTIAPPRTTLLRTPSLPIRTGPPNLDPPLTLPERYIAPSRGPRSFPVRQADRPHVPRGTTRGGGGGRGGGRGWRGIRGGTRTFPRKVTPRMW